MGTFSKGVCVLTTPSAVKHVLMDNFDGYEKGTALTELLEEVMGNGIFTSDGAMWKLHRKIGARMFSSRLLRDGTAVALKQCRTLLDKVSRHAKSSTPLDLQKAFFAFTLDTFCEIAFGISLESQTTQHPFAVAFDRVQFLSNQRVAVPAWKLFRFLGVTDAERTIASDSRLIREFGKYVQPTRFCKERS